MARNQNNSPRRRGGVAPDIIKEFPVEQPSRLLDHLIQSLPDRKRTVIKQLLAHNQVAVNGKPERQFDLQLEPGDVVKVNFTREFRVFYNRRLKIVYEDDDIIVVNKGYGLLSMGNDKTPDGTAYSILRDYVKWASPLNKIFIVHRLDRDTSGLMMFAKSEEAKRRMQHNWNNMVLNRTYVAVVEGVVEQEEGVVRSYLAETSRYEVYSTDDPEKGQLAVTRYRRIQHGGRFSLMELELDTGRKNQIRVHMNDLGHPISGDRKYGAQASPLHRLALHARTLRFKHPMTGELMDFSTPVPSGFLAVTRR
ncbi:MAG: RluA family pseudouridine synthase [Paramuribaculum sp.]|nr:RluA family pseudouridine synthase [Paramuribaculum sp.]